ncbi:MAG: STAS domain-containing protein [bacterium]
MKILTTNSDSTTMIEIVGAINVYSASVVGQAIQSLIADGSRRIVLDLSSVGAIDSSGLGTLVGNAKSMSSAGGSIVLAGVSQRVKRVLEITNLDRYFVIQDEPAGDAGEREVQAAGRPSSGEAK